MWDPDRASASAVHHQEAFVGGQPGQAEFVPDAAFVVDHRCGRPTTPGAASASGLLRLPAAAVSCRPSMRDTSSAALKFSAAPTASNRDSRETGVGPSPTKRCRSDPANSVPRRLTKPRNHARSQRHRRDRRRHRHDLTGLGQIDQVARARRSSAPTGRPWRRVAWRSRSFRRAWNSPQVGLFAALGSEPDPIETRDAAVVVEDDVVRPGHATSPAILASSSSGLIGLTT